ncbi:MAG: SPOR domain-containing protein [Alphaproteobacteria bacterium]|nr:SPOR domain-containing protein [Alphaproteobacteria bacterium]
MRARLVRGGRGAGGTRTGLLRLAPIALLAGCANWSGQSDELALRDEIAALRTEIASLNATVGRLGAPPPAPMAVAPPSPLAETMAEPVGKTGPTPQGPPAPVPTNALPHAPAAAAPGTGGAMFAIHLASYRTEARATEGWTELRLRFPKALERLQPRLAEIEVPGRGAFWRLKAGPFATWGAADAACEPLRAENWICTVMDFSGSSLP